MGMKRDGLRGSSRFRGTRERFSNAGSVVVSIMGFAIRRGSNAGICSKKSLDRGEAKIVDIEIEVLNQVRLCRINWLGQKAIGWRASDAATGVSNHRPSRMIRG